MRPNSHCRDCRNRTTEVYFQGHLKPAYIDPTPDPDGHVWLTGRRVDGTILAIHEADTAYIPGNVAIRYSLHRCPTNGGG